MHAVMKRDKDDTVPWVCTAGRKSSLTRPLQAARVDVAACMSTQLLGAQLRPVNVATTVHVPLVLGQIMVLPVLTGLTHRARMYAKDGCCCVFMHA